MTIAQLPPFDLRVVYPWMQPDAIFTAHFAQGQYWLDDAKGPIAASSLLTTTRSSNIALPDSADVFQTLGNNVLPRTDRGLYANGQFVQSAANWNAPANETISLGTGTFTLTVWGSGSIAVAAGTATGSGFGAASEGSPVTFALSGAGTVSLTVTGSPDYVSVTNTAFAPPAANPAGPVFASDIRAVQGTRPSNAQPEPFPGWEAAGLDDGFSVLVDFENRFVNAITRDLITFSAEGGNVVRINTPSTGVGLRTAVPGATASFPGGMVDRRSKVALRVLGSGAISMAQQGFGSLETRSGTFDVSTLNRVSVGNTPSVISSWNDWIYGLQICPPLSDAALLEWVNAA